MMDVSVTLAVVRGVRVKLGVNSGIFLRRGRKGTRDTIVSIVAGSPCPYLQTRFGDIGEERLTKRETSLETASFM
jgi:hypothetical protein